MRSSAVANGELASTSVKPSGELPPPPSHLFVNGTVLTERLQQVVNLLVHFLACRFARHFRADVIRSPEEKGISASAPSPDAAEDRLNEENIC